MTRLQEIQLGQSETRERLNALLGQETRSDAEATELRQLTAKMTGLETSFRAALVADQTATAAAAAEHGNDAPTDPEAREREELRSRCSIATFLRAAAEGRAVAGAEAEYAAAHGVGAMHRLPLDIFPRSAAPRPEVRAITSGPAVDGPPMPAVPFVFERTAAAALGIQFPATGAGNVQIPRVSTAPPADTLAKDGAAPSRAAAIALDSQSPKRVAGQFEIRAEDLVVYPGLESVLSEAIQGAIGNETDEEVFNGAAAGLNGLFTQTTAVAIAGSTETYASGIARFAALVDGKHAYSLADVRAVIGSATYAVYAGLFANANKGDVPLSDYLEMKLGAFRVSDRVPAKAGNGQKGVVVLGAGPSPMRVYVWNALEIIRDPYSGAGAGKVTLTATALMSELYIPYGTAMVKEVHPKIS